MINKIDKPLTRLIKKTEEKIQTNKIRNEKGEVTTDNAEIQRIIREYYEQLYGNKMDNLEEMDRFLEKFNFLRLNQEKIEIMNNPITSTEIEAVIKNLLKNKSAGPGGFTGEFFFFFNLILFLNLHLHLNLNLNLQYHISFAKYRNESATGIHVFRKEPMPNLKLFQKSAEEGTLPNSFYEATVTLIPKPKTTQRKKTTGQCL